MSENLLFNGSFEEHWHHPGGVAELQVPDFWNFWYSTVENPYSDDEWNRFVVPEVRVLPAAQLPAHERELFILDGTQTLKIFKGNGAWNSGLKQTISLELGVYRFTVQVYGDLVKGHTEDGTKIWADDPDGLDGLCRFVINGHQYDWSKLIPGEWIELSITFRAAAGPNGHGHNEVGVEWLCPYALKNSGIFADAWRLERLPDPPPPRGKPREDYERVFNVIPPNATPEAAGLIFIHSWTEGRQTVGGSYDDAGVGDLSRRVAVLWGIDEAVRQDYVDFYEEFYPGVVVVFKELD
jgi:hypothetical protein